MSKNKNIEQEEENHMETNAPEQDSTTEPEAPPEPDALGTETTHIVSSSPDAEMLNVREVPGGSIIDTLDDGKPVSAVIDGDWAELASGGFVMSKYLKEV